MRSLKVENQTMITHTYLMDISESEYVSRQAEVEELEEQSKNWAPNEKDYLCQSKWWDFCSCLTKVPQHQVEERAERGGCAGAGAGPGRSGARLGCDPLRRSQPHASAGLRSSHSHRLGLERLACHLPPASSRLVSGARYRYASAADELLLRFTFVDLLQPARSGVSLRWRTGSLV